jgi:hypothetical protein
VKELVVMTVALTLVVGACSAGNDTATTIDSPATAPPTTTASATTAASAAASTAADPDCEQQGIEAWNDGVEAWNALTEQRDAQGLAEVVVDGVEYQTYDDWARATDNFATSDDAVTAVCARAEPDQDAGTTPTTSVEANPTLAELEPKLLALDDLPTGWTTAPSSEDDDTSGSLCGTTSFEAQSVSVEYQASAMGPYLFQGLLPFDSTAEARAAFDEYTELFNTCEADTDAAGNITEVFPLNFPALGVETLAVRLTVSGTFPLEGDLLVVRTGPVLMALVHAGFGSVDSALTEQFARTGLAKL